MTIREGLALKAFLDELRVVFFEPGDFEGRITRGAEALNTFDREMTAAAAAAERVV